MWAALVIRNTLDIRLYYYILQLFDEQKEISGSYAQSVVLKVPFSALPVLGKATPIGECGKPHRFCWTYLIHTLIDGDTFMLIKFMNSFVLFFFE